VARHLGLRDTQNALNMADAQRPIQEEAENAQANEVAEAGVNSNEFIGPHIQLCEYTACRIFEQANNCYNFVAAK